MTLGSLSSPQTEMADPLNVLRDAIKASLPTSFKDGRVVVGGREFASDTPTLWKSVTGGVYTIGAVWFCYQQRELTFARYLRDCSAQKFPTVSLPDRKPLVQYLSGFLDKLTSGEIDTHPSIGASVPVEEPAKEAPQEEVRKPETVDEAVNDDILEAKASFAERLESSAKREGEDIDEEFANKRVQASTLIFSKKLVL